MTLLGHIENGMIVLDEATTLPDGMKVRVAIVPVGSMEPAPIELPKSLYERYQTIIGAAEGLPPDLAEQHDHYIHGTPKR
jgi:hypothetical protein